jgi:hypothetical protein
MSFPRIQGKTTATIPARQEATYPDWWLSGLFVRLNADGTSTATLKFHRYNWETKVHAPEPREEREVAIDDLWGLAAENADVATAMGAIAAAVAGMVDEIEPEAE